MDAYVWLDADRKDRSGSTWPEPGEFANDAVVLQAHESLIGGVNEVLWRVRFDGPPRDVPEGLLGRATLDSELERWTMATAEELRGQFFEVARGTIARMLVSTEAPPVSGALPANVIASLVAAGRQIAGASTPAELGVRIKDLTPLIQKLWPPEKKKGLFSKKVDSTLMYENLRKSMKSALDATQEIIDAASTADVLTGVDQQIAASARLARGEVMFAAMLGASNSSDQSEMDAAIEESRSAIKRVRGAGSAVAGGPAGLGGWAGGFGYSAKEGGESTEYQSRPGDDAENRGPDAGVDRAAPLPLAEATRWLALRVGMRLEPNSLPTPPTPVAPLEQAAPQAPATQPAEPSSARGTGDPSVSPIYISPEGAAPLLEMSGGAGHAHTGAVGSHDDLVRHVEGAHGERAGIYGTIQLRKKHDEWHANDPAPEDLVLPPAPVAPAVAEAPAAPAPPIVQPSTTEVADTSHAAATYVPPSATAPIYEVNDEIGHAHGGSVGSHDDLVRHVEGAHGERAGIYGTIQLRKIHDEMHAAQAAAAEEVPAAEPGAAELEPEPEPEAQVEEAEVEETEVEEAEGVAQAEPEPGPEPELEPELELEPVAKDSDNRPIVFVVPDSPAGIESARPGPEEPSAPQRAVAAAQAEKPVRSYPGPLVAHTHDEVIGSHEDLTRHVEVIHGIPVGKVDRDALVEIHDGSHAND